MKKSSILFIFVILLIVCVGFSYTGRYVVVEGNTVPPPNNINTAADAINAVTGSDTSTIGPQTMESDISAATARQKQDNIDFFTWVTKLKQQMVGLESKLPPPPPPPPPNAAGSNTAGSNTAGVILPVSGTCAPCDCSNTVGSSIRN